jgi:hypothetical protein
MNQRLRGIISSLRLDESLEKLTSAFALHFGPNEKGTLMSDLHAFRSSPKPPPMQHSKAQAKLDNHIRELLEAYEEQQAMQGAICDRSTDLKAASTQPWQRGIRLGIKHNSYGRGHITFSSFDHIRQDSYVAVGQKIPDDWYAGRIREIFTYTHRGPTLEMVYRTETYFVIERFKKLTDADALHDPYRKQPFIAGCLYYDTFEDDLELIPFQGICCHLAITPFQTSLIGSQCVHALPLDRVCYPMPYLQIRSITYCASIQD